MRNLHDEIRFVDSIIEQINQVDDPHRARRIAIAAGKRYRLLADKPLPMKRPGEWFFILFGLVGMAVLIFTSLTLVLMQVRYWELQSILSYLQG